MNRSIKAFSVLVILLSVLLFGTCRQCSNTHQLELEDRVQPGSQ